MVAFKKGYYTEDTGPNDDDAPDVFYFCMTGEPPDGQFIFLDGAWRPLIDPFYLADKLMDGDPGVGDPTDDPPEGLPPAPEPTAPAAPEPDNAEVDPLREMIYDEFLGI
jgi:hypothetical protein